MKTEHGWLAVAVLGLALSLSPCATAGETQKKEWPHYRGPDYNGISTEKNWTAAWPKEGPKIAWKAEVGTGFSSISVSEGRAFTMGNQNDTDTVFAFDALTGKELWKQSYPCRLDPKLYEGGPNPTPTVDGPAVYTLSKDGHLYCFEAATGKIAWTKNIAQEVGAQRPSWGFSGSPLAIGNLLIVNVGSAGTAVEKTTGKVVWKSGKTAAGYATPVPFTLNKQAAVMLFCSKSVNAVNPASGAELWRFPWVTDHDVNAADPIVAGDKVFISSGYNRGCALATIGGAGVWENKSMHNHFNSCVLVQGHLYGFDESTLKCLDAASGAEKWKKPGLGKGSLMAGDGKLIVLSERGELVIAEANPDAFKELARAQVLGGKCWTVPVLANGRIYARNARGSLVCVDVSGK